MALLVSNVIWESEPGEPEQRMAERLGVPVAQIGATVLVRRSLDARHGRQRWVTAYRVEVADEVSVLDGAPKSTRLWNSRDAGRYGLDARGPERRNWARDHRVIVVGAGPAGMFAALYLAEAGARVTLLERGAPVEERVKVVNKVWRRKAALDPESNLVFGEGGAGTFSDGKIYTRRRDGELGFVFRRLVDFGADADILQQGWAHLGTDKVRKILPPFRATLRSLGVDVRFHSRVTELVVDSGRCRGVVLAQGEVIEADQVIVAAGHSARDTGAMLVRAGAAAESRSIAVGARIEHPQELIDSAQYKRDTRSGLPAASYRLTHTPEGGRKVHTFCMCPGGMVVPASNHAERVVVNGMSFSTRRARWANSAVIVEVTPADYGSDDPLAGYAFQDAIEAACFVLGGGDHMAPAQRVHDLLEGRGSLELPKVSYPMGVLPTDLREALPPLVLDGLLDAVRAWDAKLPGFAGREAVLIAPETRTTSPIRFLRDERGCSTSLPGLYPCGEGAGYGGGIVSCALDGVRVARAIVAEGSEATGT